MLRGLAMMARSDLNAAPVEEAIMDIFANIAVSSHIGQPSLLDDIMQAARRRVCDFFHVFHFFFSFEYTCFHCISDG